jgi:UDP-2,4-diacetamido-2,4,6-trideoxy-beta-L-altropyranose hydrolase
LRRKVYIRADGGPGIGLGHLMRCMALAHMLKQDFNITFVCKAIPEEVKENITSSSFAFQKITEEKEFIDMIDPQVIVVLDGYDFTADLQRMIRNAGARLTCIDDLYDKKFFADLIINHAPGVKPEHYEAQPYTRFALGPEYVLLRPAFLKEAEKGRTIERIRAILICFGGADPRNISAVACNVASGFEQIEEINVVTGAAFAERESLEQYASADSRIRLFHNIEETEMLAIMKRSDVAVVPSSGVLLEALACGCIIVSGKYIDNQQILFEQYLQAGMLISAGNFERPELVNAIEKAIHQKYEKIRVFDGRSSDRLREYFHKL